MDPRPVRRRLTIGVTAAVLVVGGAVVWNGKGCDGGDCQASEPYTVTGRAPMPSLDACAVASQTGTYTYTYRRMLLPGGPLRYTSAVVAPESLTVRFRSACGETSPEPGVSGEVSALWRSRLRPLEVARIPAPTVPGSQRPSPAPGTVTVDTRTPLQVDLTMGSRLGLGPGPCPYGDIEVTANRGTGSTARAATEQVAKVRLCPQGVVNVPPLPRN